MLLRLLVDYYNGPGPDGSGQMALVQGDEVEVTEARGRELLEFPGWFEVVRTEDRGPRTEDRGRRTEDRRPRTEDQRQERAGRDRMQRGGRNDR